MFGMLISCWYVNFMLACSFHVWHVNSLFDVLIHRLVYHFHIWHFIRGGNKSTICAHLQDNLLVKLYLSSLKMKLPGTLVLVDWTCVSYNGKHCQWKISFSSLSLKHSILVHIESEEKRPPAIK